MSESDLRRVAILRDQLNSSSYDMETLQHMFPEVSNEDEDATYMPPPDNQARDDLILDTKRPERRLSFDETDSRKHEFKEKLIVDKEFFRERVYKRKDSRDESAQDTTPTAPSYQDIQGDRFEKSDFGQADFENLQLDTGRIDQPPSYRDSSRGSPVYESLSPNRPPTWTPDFSRARLNTTSDEKDVENAVNSAYLTIPAEDKESFTLLKPSIISHSREIMSRPDAQTIANGLTTLASTTLSTERGVIARMDHATIRKIPRQIEVMQGDLKDLTNAVQQMQSAIKPTSQGFSISYSHLSQIMSKFEVVTGNNLNSENWDKLLRSGILDPGHLVAFVNAGVGPSRMAMIKTWREQMKMKS